MSAGTKVDAGYVTIADGACAGLSYVLPDNSNDGNGRSVQLTEYGASLGGLLFYNRRRQ